MKDRAGGGLDGLKNQSGKCEGRGGRWGKEPEWELRSTGQGGERGKEPEWEMRRTGAGGGDQRLFEKKSF